MALYGERIDSAATTIRLYIDSPLPVLPGMIPNSEIKHQIQCNKAYWKEIYDELITQIDEIKSARTAYSTFLSTLAGAEKAATDNEYRNLINPQDIHALLRAANTKVSQIRDFKRKVDTLLNETNGHSRKNVVLPKLSLPEFDGTNWNQFWPLFESTIHMDTDLDEVQKMSYLDSLLRDDAKKTIQGLYPFSTANYTLAIDLLRDKFGKNENLIRDLHNQLSRLAISRSMDDDCKLQLDIERLCRHLEHYHQDLSSPQIYLNLEQKLSKKLLAKYVDMKALRMTTLDPPEWSTNLFRSTLKDSLELLTQVRDISQRSEKSKRESDQPSTLNLAVRYKHSPVKDHQEKTIYPKEGKITSAKPYRYRSNSESSNSSQSNRSKSPQRRGSPWPRQNRNLSSSQSRSRSRTPTRFPCQFCDGKHYALDCFKYKTIEARRSQTEQRQLCYVCLLKGHRATQCRRYNKKCFLCGRSKHHPALCERRYKNWERSTATLSEEEQIDQRDSTISVTLQSCLKNPKQIQSLLHCAHVTIYNPIDPNKQKTILAFIDNGSEKSYIKEDLVKELNLQQIQSVNFNAKGLGGVNLGKFNSILVEFGFKGKYIDMLMKARTIEKIMPELPHIKISDKDIQKIFTTKIKIPPKMEEPLMLIGGDYFNYLAIQPNDQLPSGFWISKSKLGLILSGEGKLSNKKGTNVSYNISSTSYDNHESEMDVYPNNLREIQDNELNRIVEQHNRLETIGLGDTTEPSDNEKWLKEFEDKLTFNGERYEVRLSWKDEIHQLPDNYYLSSGRLKSTHKKLMDRPELLTKYNAIIKEQLENGMIERVPVQEEYHKCKNYPKKGVLHYMPHHFVERQDKQHTKIRIVFDASAKTKKEFPSLNECLNKGPNLYNDLTGILLRARLHPFLVICDVEKAFLQISIHPDDRNALRFLWFKNPEEENSPVVEYRFTRVTFGVICSPSHLSVVLNHHYQKYNDELTKTLSRDTYVDNIIFGIENNTDFFENYRRLKTIFKEANMNIREFGTNAIDVIKHLPPEDKIDNIITKLLGLQWDLSQDTLAVQLASFSMEKSLTRRTVLSHIAKAFDPLGITSPIILRGKLFRQKIEKDKEQKLKWDTKLSKNDEIEWSKIMCSWNNQKIKIPRTYSKFKVQEIKHFQLHAFSDASELGLGCAIYVRIINIHNHIQTNLAFAKSLIIPTALVKEKRTIPSLELHAAKICAGSVLFVKREMEKIITVNSVQLWTDSADVVDLLNSTKEKDRFIRNRIKAIRGLNIKVSHIGGKQNPADIASRGCLATELIGNQLWFKGPEWLSVQEMEWPKSIRVFDPSTFVEIPSSSNIELSMAVKHKAKTESYLNYQNFSQFRRLKNATAYVLRAVKLFKIFKKSSVKLLPNLPIKKFVELIPILQADEIIAAERFLVQEAQNLYPASDETIKNLGLFQESGIWRARGRIQKSGLDHQTIHPIFIPNKSPLAEFIIIETHKTQKHAGVDNVVAKIRQQYWIPSIRAKIASVLRKNPRTKCLVCARFYAKAYDYPNAPPLPSCRVRVGYLWETVGIDYFGPMLVKVTPETPKQKVWGAIFTCALSRMIHLELVTDISAEKFILAFTRFVRRWTVPKKIISDNGTNFVLGNKALQQMTEENKKIKTEWQQIYHEKRVQEFSCQKGIEWIFIAPFAPWRGGLYERMIGTVKYHLKRELRNKLFSFEELWTILTEISRVINERPLTYLAQSEVVQPLRPIDLAYPAVKRPEVDINIEPYDPTDPEYTERVSNRTTLIENHRRALLSVEKFWINWRDDYLLSLREKHLSCSNKKDVHPNLGDIVIVYEPNAPRSCWKLGTVTALLSDRTATISIGKKQINRAIKHLFPLEVNENRMEANQQQSSLQNKIEPIQPDVEPKRKGIELTEEKTDKIQNENVLVMMEEEIILEDEEMELEEEASQQVRPRVLPPPVEENELRRPPVERQGKVVLNAPIVFIGDQNIEDLAITWQSNHLRAALIMQSAEPVNWWLSLPHRLKICDITQMIVLHTHHFEQYLYPFIQYVVEFWKNGGGQLLWIGNERIPVEGLINVPMLPLDDQLDDLVKRKAPRIAQRSGTALGKRTAPTGITTAFPPKRPFSEKMGQPREYCKQINPVEETAQLPNPDRQSGSSSGYISRSNPVEDTVYPPIPTNYRSGPPACKIVKLSEGNCLGFFGYPFIFSNFNTMYKFEINGKLWSSVEQYYVFQKLLFLRELEKADAVTKGTNQHGKRITTAEMKQMANLQNRPEETIREWREMRIDIMKEALVKKYGETEAGVYLLATGEAEILELSPDRFWGVGCDPQFCRSVNNELSGINGQNQLGKLLMELRQILRNRGKSFRSAENENTIVSKLKSVQISKKPKRPKVTPLEGEEIVPIKKQSTINESLFNEKLENCFLEMMEEQRTIDRKFQLCERINSELKTELGDTRTFVFGSTLSRLGKRGCDLDLFVCKIQPNNFNQNQKEELIAVQRIFRKILSSQIQNTQIILKGACPCLKVSVNEFKIDVTIGNKDQLNGVFNSIWLNVLTKINILFRKMSILFRIWGSEINQSEFGSFNSLSMNLLVYCFLVNRTQLPNLFKSHPEVFMEERITNFTNPTFHDELAKKINCEFLPDELSLGKALVEFFKWLSLLNFSTHKISARESAIIPKTEENNKHLITIEEPFKNSNCGRSMNGKGFDQFQGLLRQTIRIIEEENWGSLLKLFKIEVWKIIPIDTSTSESSVDEITNELLNSNTETMKKFTGGQQQRKNIFERTIFQRTPVQASQSSSYDPNQPNQDEQYDPVTNYSLPSTSGNTNGSKWQKMKRTFTNSKFSGLGLLSILTLFSVTSGYPMICHSNSESKYVRIIRNKSSCLGLTEMFDEHPISLQLNLFRPDESEFQFWGAQCSIVSHSVEYYTNLFNDPFEKFDQKIRKVSKTECQNMIKSKFCEFGPLFGDPDGVMSTANKLNFKHSWWSWGKSFTEVTNCFLKNITMITKPESETVLSAIDDLSHCHYSDSYCTLKESILVWDPRLHSNRDDWTINEQHCLFKHFLTRNGTLYRNGWLSEPPDLSLTFPENPKFLTSCSRVFAISQQGYAISEREYNKFLRLTSRTKRNLDGDVHTPQLESQLTARSLFADKEMQKALRAYSNFICHLISDSVLTEDYTHLNPTLLIRKLANISLLEGKWISSDIIEYWPCSRPHHFEFTNSQQCHLQIPVNITLIRKDQPKRAFLDSLTQILHTNSPIAPCETHQFISIKIDQNLFRINQLTGEKTIVKEIPDIEIHQKEWNHGLPSSNLQIFRLLIITNLTDQQTQMLSNLKSLRSSLSPFETNLNSGVGSISQSNFDNSVLGLLWEKLDCWMLIIKSVTVLVLAKWIVKAYLFLHQKWLKITVRRELRRKSRIEMELETKLQEKLDELHRVNLLKEHPTNADTAITEADIIESRRMRTPRRGRIK